MDWLDRIRRGRSEEPEHAPGPEAPPEVVARGAPGIAALFSGLKEDRSHAVLDFGPGSESHLRLFSRFARRIRFADLLPQPPRGAAWPAALRALPPDPRQPYDVVLAWDLFDRLKPEERPALVERLALLTGPGARLHLVLDASERTMAQPMRFTLTDLEHVSQKPEGPPIPAQVPLLPAQVERLLAPFQVVRAFTLRQGLREYMAVKAGGESRPDAWASRPP